jgi:hypothetical protein
LKLVPAGSAPRRLSRSPISDANTSAPGRWNTSLPTYRVSTVLFRPVTVRARSAEPSYTTLAGRPWASVVATRNGAVLTAVPANSAFPSGWPFTVMRARSISPSSSIASASRLAGVVLASFPSRAICLARTRMSFTSCSALTPPFSTAVESPTVCA